MCIRDRVLCYGCETTAATLAANLAVDASGYFIWWEPKEAIKNHLNLFPQRIYWDRSHPLDESWPVYVNIVPGLLACNGTPTKPELCRNGVFHVFQWDHGLARILVHQLLDLFSADGQAVLCLGDVSPRDIAEKGRVPVFYEPNKAAFDQKVADLREYYEQTIPGVVLV